MKLNKVFKYLSLVFDDVTNLTTTNKQKIDMLTATMTRLELATAKSCIQSVFATMQTAEDYEEATKKLEEDFRHDPSAENH